MATLFTALVLTAIGSAVTGSPLSETTRCYVCGPQTDRDLFPGQPPPPPCDDDGLPDVPRVCPSKYRGCLTSYDGKTLTRTCELLSLDNPCKVVNGEVFCYCGGALCNNQPVDELRGVLRDHVDVDTTEDGSGDGGVTDDEDDYSSSSSTEESTASTMAAIPTATRDLGLVGVRFTTASHRDRTTPRTTTSDDMFISSEETGASATTELSEESQPGPGPGSGSGPGPQSDVLVPGLLIAAWAVLRWRGP